MLATRKLEKEWIKGEVPDVGYGRNLNYELMVNQNPELVMVYGIGSEVTSYVKSWKSWEFPW
jgi:iron complex transport system substrate-binding protein